MFQHTAARRRLANPLSKQEYIKNVSTHSRPKAAGIDNKLAIRQHSRFQHTAARRRLAPWL